MQKKVGTILNEELLRKAKKQALSEQTTLNHIFEKAISDYLMRQSGVKRKFSAVDMSFGSMKLSRKVVEKIAREDLYEAE